MKSWEECLPHIEFAYNRAVHSSTQFSPFEIVYGFNPLTPLDLSPLPESQRLNLDGQKKAEFVKQLHEKARLNIERRTEQYVKNANKHRREVVFEPGDWVWVHMRKERFPTQRKSKLAPRSDGPFQVVKRINNNAYQLDLPGEYTISATFNVSDLSPYFADSDLRTNPFEEGRKDEDIESSVHSEDTVTKAQISFDGPMTRGQAKRFKESLNTFIQKYFEDQEIVHDFNLGCANVIQVED